MFEVWIVFLFFLGGFRFVLVLGFVRFVGLGYVVVFLVSFKTLLSFQNSCNVF